MARWSTESTRFITVATSMAPATTTAAGLPAPTARIADCGGLMIAANSSTPYMPRFVTLMLPPSRSRCCKLARVGLLDELPDPPGDSARRGALDAPEHRSDQAALGGDGHADVDGVEPTHRVVGPDHVGLGHLDVRERRRHVPRGR